MRVTHNNLIIKDYKLCQNIGSVGVNDAIFSLQPGSSDAGRVDFTVLAIFPFNLNPMALYSFSNGFLYLDVATTQQTPSGSVVILDGYSMLPILVKSKKTKRVSQSSISLFPQWPITSWIAYFQKVGY